VGRPFRRRFSPLIVALILCIPAALVGGIWLGGHPEDLPSGIRDTFVGDKNSALVREAMNVIKDDYYRKVDTTKLVNTGLAAAVKSLNDRFSNYFDPGAYKAFQRQTNGQFSGVGMTVAESKRGLKVTHTYSGSPASKAGIKAGDLIVAVNGASIAGKSSNASTALIRGKAGTPVTLTVVSNGHKRTAKLTRQDITVPLVASRLIHYHGHQIAYVELSQFGDGAHTQVGDAVRKRLAQGAKGIVLDLRGNPGGLLDEAVYTSSLFVPTGVIVSTDGRARPRHVYNATGGAISTKIPIVVLVDRNTASAAEIVTGALQDHHRATVVGTNTFGKGVFQEIQPLSNGGALDITVGEYFTPDGHNLGGGGVKEGAGLTPNVRAQDNPKTPRVDEALRVAERTLAGKLQ
jgi:carboxyl-terminal processing protease